MENNFRYSFYEELANDYYYNEEDSILYQYYLMQIDNWDNDVIDIVNNFNALTDSSAIADAYDILLEVLSLLTTEEVKTRKKGETKSEKTIFIRHNLYDYPYTVYTPAPKPDEYYNETYPYKEEAADPHNMRAAINVFYPFFKILNKKAPATKSALSHQLKQLATEMKTDREKYLNSFSVSYSDSFLEFRDDLYRLKDYIIKLYIDKNIKDFFYNSGYIYSRVTDYDQYNQKIFTKVEWSEGTKRSPKKDKTMELFASLLNKYGIVSFQNIIDGTSIIFTDEFKSQCQKIYEIACNYGGEIEIPLVSDDATGVSLYILGDDKIEEDLKNYIKDSGYKETIGCFYVILGRVTIDDALSHMQFSMPSEPKIKNLDCFTDISKAVMEYRIRINDSLIEIRDDHQKIKETFSGKNYTLNEAIEDFLEKPNNQDMKNKFEILFTDIEDDFPETSVNQKLDDIIKKEVKKTSREKALSL